MPERVRPQTGPMYEKYNNSLRFHGGPPSHTSRDAVPFLQRKCEELHLGVWREAEVGGVVWQWYNQYTTTIHAINSTVIKLAKLMAVAKVWRGFTGSTLPQSFQSKDADGVRGGVEFGFSSTTVDRAQALHYAEGKAPTVFESEMGLIDRGAVCWQGHGVGGRGGPWHGGWGW